MVPPIGGTVPGASVRPANRPGGGGNGTAGPIGPAAGCPPAIAGGDVPPGRSPRRRGGGGGVAASLRGLAKDARGRPVSRTPRRPVSRTLGRPFSGRAIARPARFREREAGETGSGDGEGIEIGIGGTVGKGECGGNMIDTGERLV